MDRLRRWKFIGIISIIVTGILMHYIYEWTGNSNIIGLFVPVNESVWEHLKLGYWSVVLLSIVEYSLIKYIVNNYYFARLIGVIILEMTILIIFYGYTFITKENIVMIDILSYFIATVTCQYLTFILFKLKPFSKTFNRISLAALIAIGILFGVTTYYPPHLEIFKDHNSNTYGISCLNSD